jgi:hypothetical protein
MYRAVYGAAAFDRLRMLAPCFSLRFVLSVSKGELATFALGKSGMV